MSQNIQLYCTLNRKKVPLTPIEEGKIKMYACGVTVYDSCHIGHAMQAIYFDVLRNFFEFQGYEVTYVRNYTDVDDKIIDRAHKLGLRPDVLANRIIEETDADFLSIGVKPATVQPRVSGSIAEIITMTKVLIEKGFAYATNEGDVYFRVREKIDYGKLSNRKPEELKQGQRTIHSGQKDEQWDFALWKSDSTPGASWQSPWGNGRPGWHIECSAMAKAHLGNHFDIHGGGLDLIFPHHENEIAQSEAANSCAYAQIWLHSGLLTLNKQKMSKSLGNSITIRQFLEKWPAEVLRLAFLLSHYRSAIDFSENTFRACLLRLLYYYETLRDLNEICKDIDGSEILEPAKTFRTTFLDALSDDFNTAAALATLQTVLKKANKLTGKKDQKTLASLASVLQQVKELTCILGLLKEDPKEFIEKLKEEGIQKLEIKKDEINALIAERSKARLEKNWQRSDELRTILHEKGIVIKDGTESTDWSLRWDE